MYILICTKTYYGKLCGATKFSIGRSLHNDNEKIHVGEGFLTSLKMIVNNIRMINISRSIGTLIFQYILYQNKSHGIVPADSSNSGQYFDTIQIRPSSSGLLQRNQPTM